MPVETKRYTNLDDKLRGLGPMSSSGITLLPKNFASASTEGDPIYEETTPTVRKILQKGGLDATTLDADGMRQRARKQAEWVGPVILVPASLYVENPQLASILTGIISNYLTDFFKGAVEKPKVELTLLVEKDDAHVHCEFNGAPDELSELRKTLQVIFDEDKD